jgi:hypothetical protein
MNAPSPPVATRRIVQIACMEGGGLYALCADGSLWSNWGSGQAWARVDTAAIYNGAT